MSLQSSDHTSGPSQDNLPVFARDLHEAPDIGFYVGLARRHGGPVLELGCGKGRVCTAIARAGIDVVGLDIDKHAIATARRTRDRLPLPVQAHLRLRYGDMRATRLGDPYNLVVLPYRSFQDLVTADDQRLVLRRVRDMLAPGGGLALDVFDPDPATLIAARAPSLSSTEHRDDRGRRVTVASERTCDLARQRVREQRIVGAIPRCCG